MSPRAAGDSRHYNVAIVDPQGGVRKSYDFISVTSALDVLSKPALVGWAYRTGLEGVLDAFAAGIPLEGHDLESMKLLLKERGYSPWIRRNAAAKRGSRAHDLLEGLASDLYVIKELPDGKLGYLDRERAAERVAWPTLLPQDGYEAAVLAWWHQVGSKLQVVACEEVLVSFRHHFAGTLDLIVDDHGTLTLLDLKTSKAVYDSHFIQLGAYALAWLEEHPGVPIEQMAVLRADEDGTWETTYAPDTPEYWGEVFLSVLQTYQAVQAGKELDG